MLEPAGLESPQQEDPFLFHKAGIRPRSDDERHETSSWETRMDYAFRAQTTAKNYFNHDSNNSNNDLYASGFSSPPLWGPTSKTTTIRARSPCPSPPRQQQRNHYRSLSPASRAQAIARGQRELMEMVSNMPESCYELSLKDLVEHPRRDDHHDHDHHRDSLERKDSQKRRSYDGGSMRRSGKGVEENGSGLLLKMVFPVSFGSKKKGVAAAAKTTTTTTKKKKKTVVKNKEQVSGMINNNNNNNTSAKVSPKPASLVTENGGSNSTSNGVDKEWWKKRYSVSASGDQSSSDQLSSSGNSGSTKSSSGSRSSSVSSRSSSIRQGSRRSGGGSGGSGGCWWFIVGKRKAKKRND